MVLGSRFTFSFSFFHSLLSENRAAFEKHEIDRMERDNLKLLNKMYSVRSTGFSYNERHTANQATGGPSANGKGRPAMGTHAINRRKTQDKIQKENQKMAMRLQTVKGTSAGGASSGYARPSRVSSGYGQQEPFRHPSVKKQQQLKKKRQPATLVQPEWNDRP